MTNLGTTALSDFNNIVEIHGREYTITRVTETTDSMGTVSNTSESTFTIYGIIFDISAKDRKVHEMGLAVPGNKRFFVKAQNDDGDIVKEGDLVTDQWSVQWRVINITKQPYTNSTEVYRSCIIQNITQEGTS